LEQLKAVTTALFPSLCFNHTSSWMGHRPISPDSLPLIGPIDSGAKVFAAFGHQHMGMTTGPITGRLIAQMIMGKDVPDFVTAFEPVRYA
jgi:D-amino-acid dehydrogenase